MDRPVLFLDCDGVINNRETYARNEAQRVAALPEVITHPPPEWVEPELVARVNKICRRTGAMVVLSTSWRTYREIPGTCGGWRGAVEVLQARGFDATAIDATPDHRTPAMITRKEAAPRWPEIRAWLDAHSEVTRWCVLDDCEMPGVPPECFVRTSIAVGLTDADVERAVRVLGAGPRQDVVRCEHCREPAAWVHSHYQCATPACPLRWSVVATCCDGECAR